MNKTIQVEKLELMEIQNMLDQDFAIEDYDSGEVIKTFTVDFGGGIQADIKICNGDGPYIDSVLFKDGVEVCVLDPSSELLGEYCFSFKGMTYSVLVELK